MPAPRKPQNLSLVEYLNLQAPKVQVSNSIPLSKYYRSVDLLQAQVCDRTGFLDTNVA